MKYVLKAKYMQGSKIVAYDIEDEKGKVNKVSSDMANRMVLANQIDGCELIDTGVDNWINSKNGNSVKELPIKSANKNIRAKAIDVIRVNNKVVGLLVEDDKNEQRRISNKKAWELAKEGMLENVTFGVDKESKVKTIRIKEEV